MGGGAGVGGGGGGGVQQGPSHLGKFCRSLWDFRGVHFRWSQFSHPVQRTEMHRPNFSLQMGQK